MAFSVKWKYPKTGDTAGFLLWRVENKWQRQLKKVLSPLGLTHAQFNLLAGLTWLGEKLTTITQAKLAQFMQLDRMMTSTVIRQMEEMNLVSRIPHPNDSRAMIVSLTSTGHSLAQKAIDHVHDFNSAFFKKLEDNHPRFKSDLHKLLIS